MTHDVQLMFAGVIRKHRERKGWTQEELARRTGLSRPMVTRLERGERMPSFPTLDKLASALGLRVYVRLVETR